MTEGAPNRYGASCPVCLNTWDFQTKREYERVTRRWRVRLLALLTRAIERSWEVWLS